MWWFIISQFSKSYKTSPFRVVLFFWQLLLGKIIYSLNPTNPLFLSEYLGVWIKHKQMGGILKWESPKWMVWGFKTPMKLDVYYQTSIFRFSATNRGLVFIKFIELDDGKIYRKALYLMVKTMVSCKFSLKPIQWQIFFHMFFPREPLHGSSPPVRPPVRPPSRPPCSSRLRCRGRRMAGPPPGRRGWCLLAEEVIRKGIQLGGSLMAVGVGKNWGIYT